MIVIAEIMVIVAAFFTSPATCIDLTFEFYAAERDVLGYQTDMAYEVEQCIEDLDPAIHPEERVLVERIYQETALAVYYDPIDEMDDHNAHVERGYHLYHDWLRVYGGES